MTSYRPFRLEITAPLTLETFHVGTGQQLSLATDSPILRDERGAPYVPASSLRGVLRTHLERESPLLGCGPAALDALFGVTPPKGSENNSGTIGRLQLSDARLTGGSGYETEVRDHVRIDPRSGAAADKAKFDSEAAIGHHDLSWSLVYEGQSSQDDELLLLAEAIHALERGGLRCGAKSGWGYGRLQATGVSYLAFDRTQPDQLAAFCAHRRGTAFTPPPAFEWPPDKPESLAPSPDSPAWSWLDLQLEIGCEGPMLVRSHIPPPGTSTAPLDANQSACYPVKGLTTADQVFVQTGAAGAYYLPGSSLRGVLRSAAHRIAQTMGQAAAFDVLFGSINDKAGTGRKSRIEVEDGTLADAARPVYLDHVAIDRITGFAADGKKFSTSALDSPSFTVRIRVRFTRQELAALALFGFVLRDLIEGWLWAGGGVTRGYGHLSRAVCQRCALNLTQEFPVPDDFRPGVERKHPPGRTVLLVPEPFAFYDLNWLWSQAETAWNTLAGMEGARK